MVTCFVEICFWVNINIIMPHTENTFSINARKEEIMNDVTLAQFLIKVIGQLQRSSISFQDRVVQNIFRPTYCNNDGSWFL